MRMVDYIREKRNGNTLSSEAIRTICKDYHADTIPDYQMSALLMAIYFSGMNDHEIFALTDAMRSSGDTITIPSDKYIVDKHSTGGVGDKISLTLLPILASLDFAVVKISGRGLGHTGGTIDKLESLKNFTFSSEKSRIQKTLHESHIALMSYSDSIVPLDKKLYSLRDVTGTVQSIPLIASSIMSKKLAVASRTILLDVKVGSGAFMKDLKSATALAKTMKHIGENAGRDVRCVLSDMSQPLGFAVGNALEMREAVNMLHDEKTPHDVYELTCVLAGMALVARGDIQKPEEAQLMVKDVIKTGKALMMLERFIAACGANPKDLASNSYMGKPTQMDVLYEKKVETEQVVQTIDATRIGNAAMILGAGRKTKADCIHHDVGIVLHKKRGDNLKHGQVLASIYYHHGTSQQVVGEAIDMIQSAYTFSSAASTVPLIYEIL